MSRGTKKRGLAAAICLAAGFALLAAAAHIPGFSQWYVTTLYPLYVGSVGRLSGIFPFSVVEILLYTLILGIILSAFYTVAKIIRERRLAQPLLSWGSGTYPKPKPVAVSEILSWQSLSGIYSPFTAEANYNADMTPYNIPFTLCHELSHLKGYMEEQEANFIAFLASTGSERLDFQYSGYLMAWIYCSNALYELEPEAYFNIVSGMNDDVLADLRDNNAFWDLYDGSISRMSDWMNDTYLRANGQADGIASYDKMVDLIISYCKDIY